MVQDATIQEVIGSCVSLESHRVPGLMVFSTWLEHAPFAYWLVESIRPRSIVELGTHYGFSYLVFCEAVERGLMNTRCTAIDTWRGDEHAGFYGNEVFEALRSQHDPRYARFSKLVRATFDEAVADFPDGSIDLLHVDGRHRYEDVKHDFLTWRPKLSDRAIVLFHDIAVHERDFGVFRFWQETRQEHPHFEFSHGHGLGVLGLGQALPAKVRPLFAAGRDEHKGNAIRTIYSRLGAGIGDRWSVIVAEAKIKYLESRLPAEGAGHRLKSNG